jgi:hypothetical protein
LVVPIPDLWLVLLAGMLGKATELGLKTMPKHQRAGRVVASLVPMVYGIAGLQLYVTGGVLFPWLLPALTYWFYLVSDTRRINREKRQFV